MPAKITQPAASERILSAMNAWAMLVLNIALRPWWRATFWSYSAEIQTHRP